ncbi:MAG: hypothetical protein OHK0029_35950 [Armatimonadaceae bacterium]
MGGSNRPLGVRQIMNRNLAHDPVIIGTVDGAHFCGGGWHNPVYPVEVEPGQYLSLLFRSGENETRYFSASCGNRKGK